MSIYGRGHLNSGVYFDRGFPGYDEPVIPDGFVKFDRPEPKCGNYHYSNKDSQGALICETPGFPSAYDPQTEEVHSAYSDRISEWDRERFQKANDIAGRGSWSSTLPSLSKTKLKEFAKVALDLKSTPKHVRIIYYFNVSNGYSCPVVLAITKKE